MDIASFIDHTLLGADVRSKDIENLCQEAIEYGFASVCVNPYFVPLARKLLRGSRIKLCTVVAFPLGNTSSQTKVAETLDSIKKGADEIDMVINISALKDGDYDIVCKDIDKVRRASQGHVLKVIIETGLLSYEEKLKAIDIVLNSGADYIKTSTGFNSTGASIEDINLIKSIVEDKIKIKASGGIKTYTSAREMIKAGASRIGASAGVSIVEEKRRI